MSEQKESTNEVQKVSTEVQTFTSGKGIDKLDIVHDKAMLTELFTTIINGGKCGLKSIQEGFSILQRAKEINVPFMAAVDHIHVVKGKTGIDIHLIKALLSRAGTITWEKTKDYVPLYEYTDGNVGMTNFDKEIYQVVKDAKAADDLNNGKIGIWICKHYKSETGIIPEYMLTPSHEILVDPKDFQTIKSSGKIPIYRVASQPVDFVVEYKFKRYRRIGNELIEQITYGKFTKQEAIAADMYSKDTYINYEKVMLATRAFTYGARDIASDLIQGCLETNELYHINNMDNQVKYTDVDDAEIIQLD